MVDPVPESLLQAASQPSRSPDVVNHPPHYISKGVESIDVIEAFDLGFHLGNVIKYILRADKAGNKLIDLRKAQWYLNRLIDRISQSDGN